MMCDVLLFPRTVESFGSDCVTSMIQHLNYPYPSVSVASLLGSNKWDSEYLLFALLYKRDEKKDTRQIQESHITYGSLQLSPFRLHFLELSFAHLFHLFSWRPDDSWATGVVCEVLPETDVPFFLLFFPFCSFLRREDWLTVVRMWICGHFVSFYGRSANASCKRIGVCTTKTFHFLSESMILARANAQSVHFNGWRWR